MGLSFFGSEIWQYYTYYIPLQPTTCPISAPQQASTLSFCSKGLYHLKKKDYIHEGKVCKVNFKYPKIFWYLSFWVLPSTFAKKFFDPWALSVRKGRDRGEKQAQICAEGCKEEYTTHIF